MILSLLFVPNIGIAFSKELNTVYNLHCAIDRAFWFIEKINSTTEVLLDNYDTTLFLEYVNELNESLTKLYENVNSENLETSIEEYYELSKDINQLNELLNSIIKNIKEDKTLKYTEHLMKLIETLEENILLLGESTESNELITSLESQQNKIETQWLTLNMNTSSHQYNEIINELEGMTVIVSSGLFNLGDEGFLLKEMYNLQASYLILNDTVEMLKIRNKSNSRLEEKLGNVNETLNQIKVKFAEKNWENIKGLIERAKEQLGNFGKTMLEIKNSNKIVNQKNQAKSEQ
jgi:hypothetical protein